MPYQHLACKCTCGLIIEHILIQFVACAMCRLMVNKCVIVYMLGLVGNHTAAEVALRSLTIEYEVCTIACDTIMQSDHIMVDTAVGLLVDKEVADPYISGVRLLEAIEVE